MTKQYSVAEARDQLAKLVHEAENGPPVEITRRGKPVAVLVSIAEYQRLAERRPGFMDAYEKWRKKVEMEGIEIDPDEIWGDIRDKSPTGGRDFSWC